MLKVKDLVKEYNSENILDGISFTIPDKLKIAVVGKNGCGKSTLFKLLADIEKPTSGSILKEREVIGYIPQEFQFDPKLMLGEYFLTCLEEDWEFYKVEALLEQLKFTDYDEYQVIETLSEGQKMKVAMITQLLKDPTLLIIDEPTNHLDIEGIKWFEHYIKYLDITVLMISHDRQFLNNTVDQIWEIEDGKLTVFFGDFDDYKMGKMDLIDKQNKEYVAFLRKKKQLEKLLTNVSKIKGGKKRGRAINAAKKRIDREITSNEKTAYEEKTISSVNFETEIHNGKLVLKIIEGEKSYGKKQVFKDFNLEIRGKDRVWVKGKNGAGKSTLVKILTESFKQQGQLLGTFIEGQNLTGGEIKPGENLKVGYFAQKQVALNKDKRLYDEFINQTGAADSQLFSTLTKFLFTRDDIKYKTVANLSPGQRARFAFAIFSLNNYDVLILDEPTNHLDIETKEVIEQSLTDYEGTLILVSHDRYFVERVDITRVIEL